MLLLLHSTFILSMVKMLLKWAVGGPALKSHGNYIVDHGNVILNFCGNPGKSSKDSEEPGRLPRALAGQTPQGLSWADSPGP